MRTVLCALVLAVAGCTATTAGRPLGQGGATASIRSGSSAAASGSAGATSFPSASISRSPVSSPASATASATRGSGRLSPSAAAAALLTTAQTGTHFTRTTIDTRPTAGPCKPAGSPTVEDRVPSTARVGAAFQAGAKAFVAEILTVYSDAAIAQRALVLGAQGLNCANGRRHDPDGTSTPVMIASSGTDTTFEGVTVDEVRGWTVTTSSLTVGLIVARMGNALAEVQLGSAKGADTSGLPDGAQIVAAALRKVKAAE